MMQTKIKTQVDVPTPTSRKLRGYAFDPSLSIQLDTAAVNTIVYTVPWERLENHPLYNISAVTQKEDPDTKDASIAELVHSTIPTGDYIEIIDYDPASKLFYPPVDLDNPFLLARDGLDPSISNPQFHQQMLYAVVMTTIANFEKALGRKVQWAERLYYPVDPQGQRQPLDSQFIQRLRIYPHALRQANAYYNPLKKSLLFGYFPASPVNSQLHLPGGTVFTCLSHDIIAHETTHAIIDGLHRRYIEPTHPDSRAFHEAFADIVALFQHFTFPEILRHQVAKTRGELASQNLLGQLAQQFGKAMGNYGGLRDAIGHTDKDGKWVHNIPDPADYKSKMESHGRGAILVATIFDAFLSIYKMKVAPILRIATGGTGKLTDGELHPDLVDKLSEEASKAARNIVNICIRSLDYCPPLNINFGDFLRAIITSDKEMVPDFDIGYRIAFIEAFQKRGIFPRNIKSMSVESLCYSDLSMDVMPERVNELLNKKFLRKFKEKIGYESNRFEIFRHTKQFIRGESNEDGTELEGIHGQFAMKFLEDPDSREMFGKLTGLLFPNSKEECERLGFSYSEDYYTAKYEISNLWLASRVSPDDRVINHVIVGIMQKRGVLASVQDGVFKIAGYFPPGTNNSKNAFEFRGGATLIFDLDNDCLKYAIKKDIADESRMEQQYRFANNLFDSASLTAYFNDSMMSALSGPFAFMHAFPERQQ